MGSSSVNFLFIDVQDEEIVERKIVAIQIKVT